MSLLGIAINVRGCKATSYTGSQAGIMTDTQHGAAKIVEIRPKRLIEALASLYPPPDRIPMTRPYFLPGRPQAEQHFAIPANEQRPDGFCDWVLHGPA